MAGILSDLKWRTNALIVLAVLAFLIGSTALLYSTITRDQDPQFKLRTQYYNSPSIFDTDIEKKTANIGCTNNTFGDDQKDFTKTTYVGYACNVPLNPCLSSVCWLSDGQCHEVLANSSYECATSSDCAGGATCTDECLCSSSGSGIVTTEFTPNITGITDSLNYTNAFNVSGLYTVLGDYIELELTLEANGGDSSSSNMGFFFTLPVGFVADTTAVNIGAAIVIPEFVVEASSNTSMTGLGEVYLYDSTNALADIFNTNGDFIGPNLSSDMYRVSLEFKYKIVI